MRPDPLIPKFPSARLVRLTNRIRGLMYKLAGKMIPPNMAVFELTQSFWIARAIGVAVELDIADLLSEKPLPVSELAEKSDADPVNLYRLLRALASYGIFKETSEKMFCHTNMSKALKSGKNSMKHMIAHQTNQTNWQMAGEMDYCIRTGKDVAVKILGTDIFQHLENHPDKNRLYNLAMTDTSNISSGTVLSAYNFSKIKKLVDIGGGHGYLLSIILRKYKNIYGIIFDLPHVVEGARETVQKFGIDDRVEIIGGDFFKSIPAGGDAYILKSIIHAFDDENCITLLKNINKSMAKNGKLLLVEVVIHEDNKPSFGKMFDLQMMIGAPGGKERTRKEFEEILGPSGFKLKRIVSTVSPFSIIEATRI